jgi:hypothetical protein
MCILQGHTRGRYTEDLGLLVTYNAKYGKVTKISICIYAYLTIMHVVNWHPPIYPTNIRRNPQTPKCIPTF